MAVAICNAEPLLDYQRQAIGEVFRCPVRETYGMAEIVAAAGECGADRLHLWPEVGFVEVLREEPDAHAPGDLVATSLLNADMPLVRYRLGDRAVLPGDTETCGCGRTLPLLAGLAGRTDDLVYTSDGRRVGRLDPVFKARLPVREAQIIQEAIGTVRVLYAPAPEFTGETGRQIAERIQERLGAVEIVLERVDSVPRERNGKFRAVVCRVAPQAEGVAG
jgi:phenylacetate-CoA ligase